MKKILLIFVLLLVFNLLEGQNSLYPKDQVLMTNFQKISLIISICSMVLILIGFYLTIYTLKRNHDWNRRSKSMDSLSISADSNRIVDLELLNKAFNYSQSNEPILLSTIDEKTKENPKLLQILLVRLNIFELYAIGIQQGVYDELLLKNSICTVMTRAYFRFKNFISKHREYNSDYCINLESLVLKWELEKKNVKPRKNTG